MDWKLLHRRIFDTRLDESAIGSIFNDVIGGRTDWVIFYRDWLRRWNLTEDRDFVRPANVYAFIRDSLIESPADPEVTAILEAIRKDFIIVPRDGVGRTSAEIIGEIRQAIREYAIQRAELARHSGKDWETVLRSGFEPSANAVITRLCVLVAKLSAAAGIICDCFCGHEKKPSSGRVAITFETGFRFDPALFARLEELIDSVKGQDDNEKEGDEKTTSESRPVGWFQGVEWKTETGKTDDEKDGSGVRPAGCDPA